MRLDRASAYALLALGVLAQARDSRPVQVQQVAQATGIPIEYLRKLLGRLTRGGVVRSMRGRNGGFRLARPANKVDVLQVVEAIEGPISDDAFLDQDLLGGLQPAARKRLRDWRRGMAAQMRAILSRTTLGYIIHGRAR